jgi:hypothetical protein
VLIRSYDKPSLASRRVGTCVNRTPSGYAERSHRLRNASEYLPKDTDLPPTCPGLATVGA